MRKSTRLKLLLVVVFILAVVIWWSRPSLAVMWAEPPFELSTASRAAQPTYLLSAQPSVAEDDPGVRHSRTQLALSVVATVWGWVVLSVLLFPGFSPRLSRFVGALTGNRFDTVPQYVILLTLIMAIACLPITFYHGFVVEHEFGLSNQTALMWAEDFVKNTGVTLITNLFLFCPIYLFMRRFERHWWVPYAGLLVVFSVIATAISPVVVSPMFNRYEPLTNQSLRQQVFALAEKGGIEVTDVLQMDMSRQTDTVNAFFEGIGPTQRIVLGDTLLIDFTDSEILTVVAHEMGHQAHNDLWRSIGVAGGLLVLGSFVFARLASSAVAVFSRRFGFVHLSQPASLPLLMLLSGIIVFAGEPLQNTYSRYIEHQADAYSLELTNDALTYATALEKIGSINLSDPNPPAWMEALFYTHPSLSERIEFAKQYSESTSP